MGRRYSVAAGNEHQSEKMWGSLQKLVVSGVKMRKKNEISGNVQFRLNRLFESLSVENKGRIREMLHGLAASVCWCTCERNAEDFDPAAEKHEGCSGEIYNMFLSIS